MVIAAPDHWHAYLAIAACKAGKDVYCEKPLSLTIHEARAMVKAARKYDRVFQTGSMQRSSNEFRKACELVRNGRIGKVKQVIVDVGPPSMPCDLPEEPMEPGLNWDLWLGPAPLRPYNSMLSPRGVHKHFPDWRNYREYSGGTMTDWAPTTSTSPSGAWAWTTADQWKSFRPRTPRPPAACAISTPTASR